MDFDELKEAIFPVIGENDPFKASKQLQIKHWYSAFFKFFEKRSEKQLSFFLDVLSDKDCWEETDTVHGIKLNRRKVARKMSQPRSWKGTINPLDDLERYQLSCWCCLEDDIINLYEHFREDSNIKASDPCALKKFVKYLSRDLKYFTDSLMEYWSHVVSGYESRLELDGKHLFVYGLECVLGKMYYKHIEAVEFFVHKIKTIPETELTTKQKDEIFMKTAVHASASTCGNQPEIFEFCFSQISPDRYSEFLTMDFEANRYYASFNRLKNAFRHDLFQKLFDCLKPSDISEDQYHHWLRLLRIEKCPQYYEYVVVKLFLHMWMRKGFNRHRGFVLKEELMGGMQSKLLAPLIKKNYMELAWAMLDKTTPGDFQVFKTSDDMKNISFLLMERDPESLLKFMRYCGISSTDNIQILELIKKSA